MDIGAYLKRINFQQKVAVTKEVLFELQRAHLLAVPFENLDIHYGTKIELNLDAIYNKIVNNRRGGFCYELNGLFFQLLKEIGFDVKIISARVFNKERGYGPEYDHLAIIAHVDNKDYLVDVGFGRFSFSPLELSLGIELTDEYGKFKFDKYKDGYLRINQVENGKLIPQYIFKTKPLDFSEFEEICTYYQTSPDSHFTQKKVISISTIDGRITLNDTQLKITKDGIEEVIEFNIEDFELKLYEHFKIRIN